MREVDQETGVLHQPGHQPLVDVLEGSLVAIDVFLAGSGRRVDRAAQHFGGVAAFGCAGHVPAHIDDKGLAAAIFDRLHHLAHKDRVDGRIADVVAHVQLERHRLTLHPLAQVEPFQDQVQLGGQGFFRFQPACRGEP